MPVIHYDSGTEVYHLSFDTICHLVSANPDNFFLQPEFNKASASDPDTMSLDQALRQVEHREQWVAALDKEIRNLEEMGTWEEVDYCTAERDVVPAMWVMKIKRRPDGSLDKFKARLVV